MAELVVMVQFDPWHMVTSFLQYLLLAPGYINVLNVYAFANVQCVLSPYLHPLSHSLWPTPHPSSDVSWGTKGDNKVNTDLGEVKTGKNTNEVEVAVPTAETDINAAYEDAIHVLSTKPPKEEQKVDAATMQEDYYRNFRTKCVSRFSTSCGLRKERDRD